MPKVIKKDLQDVEDNKKVAALSYIWIICLYGLLFKKKSDFIQFHSKQGLALFVVEVISPPLLGPVAVVPIIIAILFAAKGFLAATKGKYWVMPWVGNWIRDNI